LPAHKGDWVDGTAARTVIVEVDFEVQVRTGGVSTAPDPTKDLTSFHLLSDGHWRSLHHVTVAGHDVAGMDDLIQPQPPLPG
jgi:hypothetical protein